MNRFTRRALSSRGYKSLHDTYSAAKMKGHPDFIKVPENFRWHKHFEQVPLPRGTSGKPMNFVLTVVFYNQPCRLENLWNKCMEVSGIPLDSKRHLRQVLHQARMEGWIFFEQKDDVWYALFCQDRYEEVKWLVTKWREDWIKTIDGNPHQTEVTKVIEKGSSSSITDRRLHLEKMRKALVEANEKLNTFERTTIDYLPYTDPNGKVQFMWWYELTVKNKTRTTSSLEPNPDAQKSTSRLSPLSRTI
mmetsp:Transcript_9777/g.14796  ORF Transcript_9777/g.14796 Transcript_9777/m.14796 type:complete len:247 (-) Transcript_9777:17-757(-)